MSVEASCPEKDPEFVELPDSDESGAESEDADAMFSKAQIERASSKAEASAKAFSSSKAGSSSRISSSACHDKKKHSKAAMASAMASEYINDDNMAELESMLKNFSVSSSAPMTNTSSSSYATPEKMAQPSSMLASAPMVQSGPRLPKTMKRAVEKPMRTYLRTDVYPNKSDVTIKMTGKDYPVWYYTQSRQKAQWAYWFDPEKERFVLVFDKPPTAKQIAAKAKILENYFKDGVPEREANYFASIGIDLPIKAASEMTHSSSYATPEKMDELDSMLASASYATPEKLAQLSNMLASSRASTSTSASSRMSSAPSASASMVASSSMAGGPPLAAVRRPNMYLDNNPRARSYIQ